MQIGAGVMDGCVYMRLRLEVETSKLSLWQDRHTNIHKDLMICWRQIWARWSVSPSIWTRLLRIPLMLQCTKLYVDLHQWSGNENIINKAPQASLICFDIRFTIKRTYLSKQLILYSTRDIPPSSTLSHDTTNVLNQHKLQTRNPRITKSDTVTCNMLV